MRMQFTRLDTGTVRTSSRAIEVARAAIDSDRAQIEDPPRTGAMEALIMMGFPEHWCTRALAVSGGDVEAAATWIMEHIEEPEAFWDYFVNG